MSEYWVSRKRHHCKYCNIYIADDVPSRQHHENGVRHKGNVERFVRGLYKATRAEETREMEKINKAATAAYAQDVGVGLGGVGPSSRGAPVATPAQKKPQTNPYANYSTPASLGYADPDAERTKAAADISQTMGVAGDWQYVQNHASGSPARNEVPSVKGNNKREALVDDIEGGHIFKLRKKTVSIGLRELYDPGVIKVKVKKELMVPQPAPSKTL
ncbi:uncharacterized protein HD556DRAFT_1521352 [Suillus plorans]|uniref:Matrin-type domain-containing protein n=1 Tax=Suillus plorans TaxID=116603 RepID=A0A9P7AGE4_9AGAM|nr:uncharacterized protein HD556DRAFT_1521352 [Suillus plorans]KAG1787784.1 hypothetical protein HD556DRAFT_1521352 [Suillus plorans]